MLATILENVFAIVFEESHHRLRADRKNILEKAQTLKRDFEHGTYHRFGLSSDVNSMLELDPQDIRTLFLNLEREEYIFTSGAPGKRKK